MSPALASSPLFAILPEVAEALSQGRPVVALESTVIAQGLPRPINLETARSLEAVIRRGGAVPATVAVLDGKGRVGLDGAALDRIAEGGAVAKLSRRDLGPALATGEAGATTASATLAAAGATGIRVFVTGGIGGVHRNAGQDLDVSADLLDLSRCPVAVVASGAKSILDLPRTLELLETLGVPVIGYRCNEFPAFYARSSGLGLERHAESAAAAAAVMRRHWALGNPGGLLIANPIPEAEAIPGDDLNRWTETALAEAADAGIAGKAVTPFLLYRLRELSNGRTLASNLALLEDNARAAAAIASAFAEAGGCDIAER